MIVITTPTGLIGHQVLDNVLEGGDEPVRVILRDPANLPSHVRGRVEVVEGSHGDRDVVDRAFDGADSLFWLVPPDPHAESVEAAYVDFSRPAGEAFTSQGVKRVVTVSALGRGTAVAGNAGFVTASLAMDDLIASTGVSFRALTMPSFMDNIVRQVGPIKNRGMFFSPIAGDRKPRPSPRATSLRWPPTCFSTIPGPAATTSRCSAPRTCPSTTWRTSCPKC